MYPFGKENSFLHYFGTENVAQFLSLRNLVFSRSVSFDIIRYDHNYGMNFCIIGVQALATKLGNFIIDHLRFLTKSTVLSTGIYFFIGLYYSLLAKNIRYYRIDVDGNSFAGNYTGLVIANQPFYGPKMYPMADARPDDGLMDLYVIKPRPFRNALRMGNDYIHGHYERWPKFFSHYQGKRISITSDQVMPVCLDGEIFFDAAVHAELIPHALEFTGPTSIEIFGKGRPHE
jgi:diacylglycerol kinase family enzyme